MNREETIENRKQIYCCGNVQIYIHTNKWNYIGI